MGSSRKKILIDTGQGMPVWIDRVAQVAAENDIQIVTVLLTHWHGDHAGGVADILKRYPHLLSAIHKNRPDQGQQDIEDEQVFRVDGATVRAVYTPGHAVDHMCFVLEEELALFTGDNVLGHGFTVVEDLGTYMKSLEVMQSQGCLKGYPAHGSVIYDLPLKLKEYKSHRLRRERQIVLALQESRHKRPGRGSVTIEELVQAVHGSVSKEASKMALEPSMNEVLMKLASDRMVGFELQRGAKRWFVNDRVVKC